MALKIALFAEGPQDQLTPDHPFVQLWQNGVLKNLGLPEVAHVYAINKKFLISMRSGAPKISGASIRLDEFIERKRKADGFDCAIVAWDLVPGWAGGIGKLCRWQETLDFYEGISKSKELPQSWVTYAANRHGQLLSRPIPSQRLGLTKVSPGAILALCMDSMFESLITADEKSVKQALGCKGKQVKGWPNGWKSSVRPDSQLLEPAIDAVRRIRPLEPQAFVVRGNMITEKHEWGLFLLNEILGNLGSIKCSNHAIAARLRDLLY